MNRLLKNSLILGLVGILLGCGKAEIEKLRSENASLKQEVTKLKETAEYHYQQGLVFLKDKQFEKAKNEFEIVVSKYPSSQLVENAKQQIDIAKVQYTKLWYEEKKKCDEEEKRRKEEEKYRPRSWQDAFKEWRDFRKNEEAYRGTITTWKIKVVYVGETIQGCLMGAVSLFLDCRVAIPSLTYLSYHFKIKNVVREDLLVVTGKFEGLSSDGYVILDPIKVVNEGYK